MPETQPYSIALLVETSSVYGRQVLKGFLRYIHSDTRHQWQVVLEERDLNAGTPAWLNDWKGDGLVSRCTTDEMLTQVRKRGIAFVELTDRFPVADLDSVRSDDAEIGAIGAEHLQERGFRHFAFCGFSDEAWSRRRQEAFEKCVGQLDQAECHFFESPWYGPDVQPWEQQRAALTTWLKSLPKPVGIMACNDLRGKQLIDCCLAAAIPVPETVAIVGVDNDELVCSFCSPPLSSILPNAEAIGFQAASLLDQQLKRQRREAQAICVPPLGISVRQSTDIVAVEDQSLAEALKYIRDHACQGISVGDVVKATGVSRSSLERKLRTLLGRTPQQEIRNVQLKRACSLLAETSLPIEEIAIRCGFEHPEYMHVVFKREMQITPGAFRRAARPKA